jgi:hypothetical protein
MQPVIAPQPCLDSRGGLSAIRALMRSPQSLAKVRFFPETRNGAAFTREHRK